MNRTHTLLTIGTIAVFTSALGALIALDGGCYGVGIAFTGLLTSLMGPGMLYIDSMGRIVE